MELVDATDLKSVEVIRVGSSPTGATNNLHKESKMKKILSVIVPEIRVR